MKKDIYQHIVSISAIITVIATAILYIAGIEKNVSLAEQLNDQNINKIEKMENRIDAIEEKEDKINCFLSSKIK